MCSVSERTLPDLTTKSCQGRTCWDTHVGLNTERVREQRLHLGTFQPLPCTANFFSHHLQTALFADWVSVLVWLFAKLSFFLLYIQIFRPMKWLRYSAYGGATVNVLYYTLNLTLTLAYSVPSPGQTLQQSILSPRQPHELNKSLPTACLNLVLDV